MVATWLVRLFLLCVVLSALLLCAVGVTYLERVEVFLRELFQSARTVLLFRGALLLLAAVLLGLYGARRQLSARLHREIEDFERFRPEATPAPAAAPRLESALTAAALAITLSMLVFALGWPRSYQILLKEDGPVEYASAVFWLFATLLLAAGLLLRRGSSRPHYLAYGFFLLFFFVCGGEEISWGQRLLGFQGPDALLEINKQGETNLHNIGSISIFTNGLFLFTLLFFLAVPRLLKRDRKLALYLCRLGCPHVSPVLVRLFAIGLLAWLVIGVRYGTLGFSPLSLWGHYNQLDDEFLEFFIAYSFLAFALLDLAACLPRPRSSEAPAAASLAS